MIGDHETQYRDAGNLDARAALYVRYRKCKPFRAWVFDHLDGPPQARVLDVGSGPGGLWTEQADRIPPGWGITLLDQSFGMLLTARDRAASAGLAPGLVQGEAEELPFHGDTFDIATAFHMLYDVSDIDRAVAELRRVIRPGGTLVATTNGDGHFREMKEALFAVGLRGEVVEYAGHASFSVENGAEILGRAFSEVSVHRSAEVFEVDDPEPLVAYARSIEHLDEQLDPDRESALRALVHGEIGHEGAFRLGTDSALFLAG